MSKPYGLRKFLWPSQKSWTRITITFSPKISWQYILHENKNDFSDLISTPFLVRGMAQCLCVSCKSIISCYFWGLVALRYYSFWKCPCHCPEYIFQKSSKLLCKNFNVKIAVLDLELSCWFVQCSWMG